MTVAQDSMTALTAQNRSLHANLDPSRPESPAEGVRTRTAEPPPHAPELGLMRRLLGPLHVTGVFWYRFHAQGLRYVPEWAKRVCTVAFTSFFFIALRRIRRAIASNLEAVLGPCGWFERQRRIYRTMWNFAWCLTERYERIGPSAQQASRAAKEVCGVEGEDTWRRALESPEGWILVTAHIGHWEVGSLMAPEDASRHVHVVREEEMDKQAQEFVRSMVAERHQDGLTMHFAGDDPALGAKLLQMLRRGDLVAVQGDRPRAAARSVKVQLFDRPIELPAGPAALARAAGVVLMPVFVFRTGRHHSRIVFRPPVRVDAEDRDLSQAMQRIADQVQWAIEQEPYQWFCFRELWKGS